MEVVSQSGILFNTTGVISKDNNVYFMPSGVTTPSEWYQKLVINCACTQFNSDLSSWSPEDKTLRIKGQIDSYRNYATGNLLWNYLIITRKNSSGTIKAYVAFFIDSVKQAGLNAVELSLTPDYFTNTFLLNMSGSDTLNDSIKNAYIDRQHYNRVKLVEDTEVSGTISLTSELLSNVNYHLDLTQIYNKTAGVLIKISYFLFIANEGCKVKITDGTNTLYHDIAPKIYFAHNYVNDPLEKTTIHYLHIKITDSSDNELFYKQINYTSQTSDYTFVFSVNTDNDITSGDNTETYLGCITQIDSFAYDNLDLFANTEEKYNFRYQYKDLKTPLIESSLSLETFSKSELKAINNASQLSELSNSIVRKIVKACIYWYVILCKKSLPIPYKINKGSGSTYTIDSHFGKINDYLKSNLCYLALPFVNIPSFLNKFSNELSNIYFKYSIQVYNNFGEKSFVCNPEISNIDTIMNDLTFSQSLSLITSLYASYIQCIYITKSINDNYTISINYDSDYPLIYTMKTALMLNNATAGFSFKDNNIDERLINCWLTNNEEKIAKYMAVSGFYPEADYTYQTITITSTSIKQTENVITLFNCFLLNSQDIKSFQLKLVEEVKNPKDTYFETLLTFEPYQFWSISLAELNECIFNKDRYYQSYNNISFSINLKYTFSLTSGFKVAYIVNYDLNGVSTPYYNDSLILTSNASLPFMSESYFAYLYQNMAMMKNQYALAEKNGWEDLGQRFFNTAPANVGASAVGGFASGGPAGAAAGAISQTITEVSGMIDDTIDLGQNLRDIRDTQKATYSGVGAKPNALKETATDIIFDSNVEEMSLYLNHYNIDTLSYNNIAHYLERFGYQVKLFDKLNVFNRVGYNYIKLVSFDIVKPMSLEQENAIRRIFKSGVTLLHEKDYLSSETLHNYETILKEVN